MNKIRYYAIKNLKCQIDQSELRKKYLEILYLKEIPITGNMICEWCGFRVDSVVGSNNDEIVITPDRITHPKWHTMDLIECTRCPNFIWIGSSHDFLRNSSGWVGGTIKEDNVTCERCSADYWSEPNLFES